MRQQIAADPRPSTAKRLGRELAKRSDWEAIKLRIMEEVLRLKFADPHLRAKLLSTGTRQLVEGNTWGETYWGVCRGVGTNRLGELLMKIRADLDTL